MEDDPYGALRFEGDALPSLLTIAGAAGGVIQLSTFSKTLAPGLRVGWVVAPAEVIGRLALAKQGTDLHTGTLDQYIVHELLANGQIEAGLPAIVARYRERRDTMLAALAEHFPAGVRWTHPTGGMFLWVTLPDGIAAADLLPAAVERGVAFVPGRVLLPQRRRREHDAPQLLERLARADPRRDRAAGVVAPRVLRADRPCGDCRAPLARR